MSDKTLITAHSGSDGTPDNSLSCVEYALSTAADAFEVDVRRLSDGTLALGHDAADHTAPTLREVFTLAAAKPGVRVNCDLKERGLEPDVAALERFARRIEHLGHCIAQHRKLAPRRVRKRQLLFRQLFGGFENVDGVVGNSLKVAHKLQQLRDLLALAVAERLHCAELEHA